MTTAAVFNPLALPPTLIDDFNTPVAGSTIWPLRSTEALA